MIYIYSALVMDITPSLIKNETKKGIDFHYLHHTNMITALSSPSSICSNTQTDENEDILSVTTIHIWLHTVEHVSYVPKFR